MKRRWLVVIPAVFLLLIGITFAAEQPAVSISEPVGDRMVQPQQPARELQNQIDALARQLEAMGEVPTLPPAVKVVPTSPFGEVRPYQYNGMTFWWIPLSTAATKVEAPGASPGTVKLLDPK